jgi:hypothetical protein
MREMMKPNTVKYKCIICCFAIFFVKCELWHYSPQMEYYHPAGLTIIDISGYWFSSGADIYYGSKDAKELCKFTSDSNYYYKREMSDQSNLYTEEYGTFSIGGEFTETIITNCKRSIHITKNVYGSIDTVDNVGQPAQMYSHNFNMRKLNGKIIEYEIATRSPDGTTIVDYAAFSRIDSLVAEPQMWKMIPRP